MDFYYHCSQIDVKLKGRSTNVGFLGLPVRGVMETTEPSSHVTAMNLSLATSGTRQVSSNIVSVHVVLIDSLHYARTCFVQRT